MRRFLAILLCLIPSLATAQTLTVSAAISLKNALTDAAEQYQKQSGENVRLNFGASGDLANQIVAGAPVDLFISAGQPQIEQLQRAKLTTDQPAILVRNELVLIAPADTHDLSSWGELRGAKRIAIGDPKSVPAGEYAGQVFEHLKLSQPLASKLIYGANVRQVLAYVERGEVDAGVVYATDAKQAGAKVRVVAIAPAQTHDPIEYPAVLIRGGETKAAEKFLKFLGIPTEQEIFVRFGFEKGEAVTAEFASSLAVSLRVACAATALVILLGVPAAWWLARSRFVGKNLIVAGLALPLVMPPTVVGYLLVILLGNRGLLGAWVKHLGLQFMFTETGAIVAAAVVAFPLLLLPAKAAFENVSREMEEIARLMGASSLGVFWHVSLPLAHRGIGSGALLAFARSLGEFGATVMVLGQIPGKMTLPISIYEDYVDGEIWHAWPAVAALVAASIVAIALYNHFAVAET